SFSTRSRVAFFKSKPTPSGHASLALGEKFTRPQKPAQPRPLPKAIFKNGHRNEPPPKSPPRMRGVRVTQPTFLKLHRSYANCRYHPVIVPRFDSPRRKICLIDRDTSKAGAKEALAPYENVSNRCEISSLSCHDIVHNLSLVVAYLRSECSTVGGSDSSTRRCRRRSCDT